MWRNCRPKSCLLWPLWGRVNSATRALSAAVGPGHRVATLLPGFVKGFVLLLFQRVKPTLCTKPPKMFGEIGRKIPTIARTVCKDVIDGTMLRCVSGPEAARILDCLDDDHRLAVISRWGAPALPITCADSAGSSLDISGVRQRQNHKD